MITSRQNNQIKAIRKLITERKERERQGLLVAEGIRLTLQALESGVAVQTLVCAPELLHSPAALQAVEKATSSGIPCLETSAHVFAGISGKDNPQGILAVTHLPLTPLESLQYSGELCWIALDRIQDPGNMGTILRIADAVGAAGIILLGNTADPFHPRVARGSMGAIFTRQIVRADFDEFIRWKQQTPYTVIAAISQDSPDYHTIYYQQPFVLLMGSEQHGLAPELLPTVDMAVSIPMVGQADSLNVAIATAVIAYEAFNHR